MPFRTKPPQAQSRLINATNIAWVLRTLANEPGESGGMLFGTKSMGRLASAVLNARRSGLASLRITVPEATQA